jgi:hypothetical protein
MFEAPALTPRQSHYEEERARKGERLRRDRRKVLL